MELLITYKKETYIVLYDSIDHNIVSKFKWRIQKGSKNQTNYVATKIDRRSISMHRLIMGVLDEPTIEIDHADRNGLNNCRSN